MDCKSCIQRCFFFVLLFINLVVHYDYLTLGHIIIVWIPYEPEKNLNMFGRNSCFILTWLIIQINKLPTIWRIGVCHDYRLCLDRVVLQRCDRLVLVLPICVYDVISTLAGLWQRVEHVFLCWRNDEFLKPGSLEWTTTRLLYE